jgi:hypothetical protein
MNQNPNSQDPKADLRPEYDFSTGVRGRHHAQYQEGTNVVLLDSDVAEYFHDSASVNEALRLLARIAREQAHPPRSA